MLVFLDTETTGLDEQDRICSLGIIAEDKTYYELIKSPRKIRPESSAVHHLTNEMLKDKKVFKESGIYKTLQEYNNIDNILIMHNAPFDLKMLQKENFVWQGAIVDTLKCVRHLIPECEQFSLQYLRYELKLYKLEKDNFGITLQAHNALSDALHVKLLYEYLLDIASLEELQNLTMEPILISKFTFGKYKGRYIEEIAMNDASYLHWMLHNMSSVDEDLQYSLEYWLKGISK
jgi:DNA polymerase-3 subunit epsilon/exodeoxyribonuclease X